LLIDSYITSKNYAEALELLKGKNSIENKKAYQKVAFYRGVELYNESNYQEAKDLFNKSLAEKQDQKYTAKATFWKAETDYNLTNYDDALSGFKQFSQFAGASNLKEYKNLNYNLAYTYFKQKDYSFATQYFNQFVNSHKEDKVRLNDAYLRLADAYFVSTNYNSAITAYDNAIRVGELETDYAAFQKAMSYGYLGNNTEKVNKLKAFISSQTKSKLRDDAMYALGNTYMKSGQDDKAISMYSQLKSEYRNSPFVVKAELRQGLIFYNKSQNEKALSKFKNVASKYPGTPEANQAVASARLIYIDLGRVDEYASWVRTLDYVEVTDADRKTVFR